MPELYNASEYLPEFISAVAETGVDFKDAIQAILDYHPETISWATMEDPTFDLGKYHKTGNLMVYAGVNHPKKWVLHGNASNIGIAHLLSIPYGVMIREIKNEDNSYTMTYTIAQGQELLIIKNTTSVVDPTSGKPVYSDMDFSTNDVLYASSYNYQSVMGGSIGEIGYVYLDNWELGKENPELLTDKTRDVLVVYRMGEGYADGWYLRTNYNKKWTFVRFNDQMDLSVYDPKNKKLDIFKYADDGMKQFDAELVDWVKHKANELKLRHTTAEMQADYDARISPTQLAELQDKKLESAKQDADSSFEDSLHLEASEESLATLNTDFTSHLNSHIDADDIARWDNKADADHMHKADDGKTTQISVGSDGIILRSTDNGLSWTKITVSGITSYLYDIHYANHTWIAVGLKGFIIRSTDNGLTWTKITLSGITEYLFAIHHGNGIWIATGGKGTIVRSTDDGLTWTKITVSGMNGTFDSLNSIYYSNNTWIAVGTNGLIRSTNNGLTWTKNTINGVTTGLSGIHYANNTWIAVGFTNIIHSTDDGLTWTQMRVYDVSSLQHICYANHRWLAVGGRGSIIRGTNNGLAWTNVTVNGLTSDLQSIHYVNNTWIAVGTGGTIIRSTDNGLAWSTVTVSGISNNLWGTYGIYDPVVEVDASNIDSGVIDHERFSEKVKNQSKIIETRNLATLIGPAIDTAHLYENQKIKLLTTPDPRYFYITDLSKMGTEDYLQGLQEYTNKIDPNAEIDWNIVTDVPTTVQDFGIKDTYKKTEVDTIVKNLKTDIDTEKNKTTVMQSQLQQFKNTTYPYEYPFKMDRSNDYIILDILKDPEDATPTNPLIIPGLYARVNEGTTIWMPPESVWIIAGTTSTAETTLLRSVDNGENWNNVSGAPYAYLLKIFYGDGTWIAVGIGINNMTECWVALRSITSGVSWTQHVITTRPDTILDIHYANGVWIASGAGGYIYRSIDDGITWTEISIDQSSEYIYLGALYNHDNVWVIGTDNTIYRSTDNGLTWNKIDLDTPELGSIYAIGYGNGILVAVGNGYVFRSTDNGLTWTKKILPFMDPILLGLCYANNTWIAVGDKGRILRSIDDGVTWTKIAVNNVSFNLQNVHYANTRWIAVGEGNTVLYSDDDGLTWVIRDTYLDIESNFNGVMHASYNISDIPQEYSLFRKYDLPEVKPTRYRTVRMIYENFYGIKRSEDSVSQITDPALYKGEMYAFTAEINMDNLLEMSLYRSTSDPELDENVSWDKISSMSSGRDEFDPEITVKVIATIYIEEYDVVIGIVNLGNNMTYYGFYRLTVKKNSDIMFVQTGNDYLVMNGAPKHITYIGNRILLYTTDANNKNPQIHNISFKPMPDSTVFDRIYPAVITITPPSHFDVISHDDTQWLAMRKDFLYVSPLDKLEFTCLTQLASEYPISEYPIDLMYSDKIYMLLTYFQEQIYLYRCTSVDELAYILANAVSPNNDIKPVFTYEFPVAGGCTFAKLLYCECVWFIQTSLYHEGRYRYQYAYSDEGVMWYDFDIFNDYTCASEDELYEDLLVGRNVRLINSTGGGDYMYEGLTHSGSLWFDPWPNSNTSQKFTSIAMVNKLNLQNVQIMASNKSVYRLNGGTSDWEKIPNFISGASDISAITNLDNVWLIATGISDSVIYISNDTGLSWEIFDTISPATTDPNFKICGLFGYGDEVMAVCSNGETHYTSSSKEYIFRLMPTGITTPLRDVCCAHNRWIAVGDGGVILIADMDLASPENLTWTKINVAGFTADLNHIKYGDGVWMATGPKNTLLRSTDNGLTWTKIEIMWDDDDMDWSNNQLVLETLAYGNKTWVIGCTYIGGYFVYSLDNGETWDILWGFYSDRYNHVHAQYYDNIWMLTTTNTDGRSNIYAIDNVFTHSWWEFGTITDVANSTIVGSSIELRYLRFNHDTGKFIRDLPIPNYMRAVDDFIDQAAPKVSSAKATLAKVDKSTFK